jgi:hypothetical protein
MLLTSRVRRPCAALLAGALGASVAVAPVRAQTPVLPLSDLVNQPSDYAQRELLARGYVFTHSDQNGGKVWQYWWQSRDAVCARVAHVDGRATSIVGSSATDCNQRPGVSPPQTSSNANTGAAVAIGAAALLGIAALTHRSHERDQQKHQNEQQVAEFERGYRDGLYHQAYHDYNRSQAYVDGYNAGQQKRDVETRYRSPYGYHSGTAPYASLSDMTGMRASGLDADMQRRGFVTRGGYQANERAYATWWNGGTRQCVQVVTYQGRVEAVNPLVEGNCL